MQRTVALTLLVAGGLVFTACEGNRLTGFEDQLLEKRAGARGSSSSVVVMTRNLYVGADVDPIVEAAADPDITLEEIMALVDDAFQMMLFTNYLERAGAIADEILATNPDLIGLQEASLIQAGELVVDFVAILLAQLQARQLDYAIASSVENTSVTVPRSETETVTLVDSDVILARSDVPTSNPVGVNYQTVLGPFDLLGQTLTVVRGFAAVDAEVDGRKFRFVNTHTESASDLIRQAQIGELIQHLAGETLPVILVGDLNTDGYTREPGYQMLMDAGYKDAWVRYAGYKDLGFTSGHESDLQNETAASFHHRIDLILATQLGWAGVDIVGEEPEDRFEVTVEVAPGVFMSYYLWPSDHAGVVGQLHIPAPRVTVEN
jgi:endonuclease/exonuclease/phosphatase family metal-dependent hydrolase